MFRPASVRLRPDLRFAMVAFKGLEPEESPRFLLCPLPFPFPLPLPLPHSGSGQRERERERERERVGERGDSSGGREVGAQTWLKRQPASNLMDGDGGSTVHLD